MNLPEASVHTREPSFKLANESDPLTNVVVVDWLELLFVEEPPVDVDVLVDAYDLGLRGVRRFVDEPADNEGDEPPRADGEGR